MLLVCDVRAGRWRRGGSESFPRVHVLCDLWTALLSASFSPLSCYTPRSLEKSNIILSDGALESVSIIPFSARIFGPAVVRADVFGAAAASVHSCALMPTTIPLYSS